MRCTNCGWSNNETDTHCIKCRNPLKTSQAVNEPRPMGSESRPSNESRPSQGTISGKQAPAPLQEAEQGAASARETINDIPAAEGSARTATSQGLATEVTNCPSCGYLVSKRAARCPRCGRELAGAATGTSGTSGKGSAAGATVLSAGPGGPSSAPTVVSRPDKGDKEEKGDKGAEIVPDDAAAKGDLRGKSMTIDPYRQKAAPKKEAFFLRMDNVDEPPVLLSFGTKEDTIDLNRDNLDAFNNTITGKVQAQLNFDGEKWHIRDGSEQKTTFLQLAEAHELKDGDILLIGNKRFVFYSKNPNL